MTPPQLARDAPVVDVPHPLEVDPSPGVGNEAGVAALDRFDSRAGKLRNADEPLRRDERLDDRVTALAVTDRMLVGFGGQE